MKKVSTASSRGRGNRRKGQRGELQAKKWLESLGFDVGDRQSQYRSGVRDGNELVVEGVLQVEVKFQTGFNVGTKHLGDACAQAERDAKGKPWCVVWRATGRRQWILTHHDGYGNRITRDTDIGAKAWIAGIIQENEV